MQPCRLLTPPVAALQCALEHCLAIWSFAIPQCPFSAPAGWGGRQAGGGQDAAHCTCSALQPCSDNGAFLPPCRLAVEKRVGTMLELLQDEARPRQKPKMEVLLVKSPEVGCGWKGVSGSSFRFADGLGGMEVLLVKSPEVRGRAGLMTGQPKGASRAARLAAGCRLVSRIAAGSTRVARALHAAG